MITKNNSSVDEEEVNKIVEIMKRKYQEDGMIFGEVNSTLKELRGIITDDTYAKIDIESEEDLEGFGSDLSRTFGKIYLKLKRVLVPTKKILKAIPISDELSYYLYSANMHYSSSQYLALASAAGFVAGLVALIAGFFLGILTNNILFVTVLPFVYAICAWLVVTIILISMPKQKAISRGNACSIELPFALRHMSTELKAGIGLYKTIQAIASNSYGVLSEEFSRTINEIEEGSDTGVALKHLALRTQSRPLKTTINHILRAMRVGGNLSEVMSDIAEDVSEDLKSKIRTFAQKMNFFSVIFIFLGIVLPVAIMILGAIRNSPLAATGQDLFKNIPLSPMMMLLFYLVFMPVLYIFMILLVYVAQPKM
jgi:pilus assembly protein TadC